MNKLFRVAMLPARLGDCLWIEYGQERNTNRILIDGGVASTYNSLQKRIRNLPRHQRHFELFIITHVDSDHIEGAVKLLGSLRDLQVTFGDIWFNGWKHLSREHEEPDGLLGGIHGEFLSALIERRKLPWNDAFEGSSVVVPDHGRLPRHELPGGMTLTLLSPTMDRLADLRPKWQNEIRAAGLDRTSTKSVLEALTKKSFLRPLDDPILSAESPLDIKRLAQKPFVGDFTQSNGSSIAVLAEYNSKSCLLTGDAQVATLHKNIKRLIEERKGVELSLDALKMSHHGSRGNISGPLLEQLKCNRYLFSTDGSRFRHPDREAVARVIVHGGPQPSLIFNYRTEFNRIWDDPNLLNSEFGYTVQYPADDEGIAIDI